MGILIGGLLIPIGGVGGVRVGGVGGSISASLGAQAFLRRRDAVGDTEGVLAYFGDVAEGEEAIAGLGPVGNEWSVISRERDPGLSAIAGVPDGTTYTSRAFLSSDLNQTEFVLRGFDPAITSARWSGTLATRQSAGEGTVVAGEILFYYWEQAQTSGARTIYAISTDADYLFNSVILWQGYTNNNYRGFLREHVKWLHDVTFDNNLAGEGRFANDAAALAYIVENKAYFQGRLDGCYCSRRYHSGACVFPYIRRYGTDWHSNIWCGCGRWDTRGTYRSSSGNPPRGRSDH